MANLAHAYIVWYIISIITMICMRVGFAWVILLLRQWLIMRVLIVVGSWLLPVLMLVVG